MSLTPERLAEIRERLDGATPGPWRHEPALGHVVSRCVLDGKGYLFAQVDDGQNADFIAHAREDVPALLALVDELMLARNEARELVSEMEMMLTFGPQDGKLSQVEADERTDLESRMIDAVRRWSAEV